MGLGIVAALVIPRFAGTQTDTTSNGSGTAVIVFTAAIYITAIWVSLATAAKRWHDLDKSG